MQLASFLLVSKSRSNADYHTVGTSVFDSILLLASLGPSVPNFIRAIIFASVDAQMVSGGHQITHLCYGSVLIPVTVYCLVLTSFLAVSAGLCLGFCKLRHVSCLSVLPT